MTTTRGRYSSGEQTRIRLVEAAERLFARRGYDGVTLADIRKAAGQHNSSVIGYYFGTKEGLLLAVFTHRLPSVDSERAALLAEMLAEKGRLSTRDALWAIVKPLAGTIGRNNRYVALLDRLMHSDRFWCDIPGAHPCAGATGRDADLALRTSIGHLPDDIGTQRLDLVYGSILGRLAHYDRRGLPPTRTELTALVDAWEALLLAPVSDETHDARRAS
ncbi:TetR/AcrR family transcriptional regulator [Rhodococcus sp. DT1]|uniref:TetR/AcrR family transcriptional regulator n=1 Tax=Rhodococcus sp. DT1 TaxID=3416544 RepID=UPI003CF2C2B3